MSQDDDEDDIGIPNVPAIVWYEQQKLWLERSLAGLCWRHNIPLIDDECPLCDEMRNAQEDC